MTTDNFCFYLQNWVIQTSQTGAQPYSDTSPFSIPWQQWQTRLYTFLGLLGRHNTDRIISNCVTSPKVAKASTVPCRWRWRYHARICQWKWKYSHKNLQTIDIYYELLLHDHRYLRDVDLFKAYWVANIHFNKTGVLVVGTGRAGGLTRQVGWMKRCAHFICQYFYGSH
jgi:hypothetical protein